MTTGAIGCVSSALPCCGIFRKGLGPALNPGSELGGVSPRPFEIFVRLLKSRFDSPRSMVPMNVRCIPMKSANDSASSPSSTEAPGFCPNAFNNNSCTSSGLEVRNLVVYSVCIDTVYLDSPLAKRISAHATPQPRSEGAGQT